MSQQGTDERQSAGLQPGGWGAGLKIARRRGHALPAGIR
jgi:hypothetical protein